MALVVPNIGELTLLERLLNNTDGSTDILLRLYTNAVALNNNTVAGDFIQPVGGWYTEKTLTTGSWTTSVVSNKGEGEYAEQSWTVVSDNPTIRGYYVVLDDGSSTLLWAEEFASPRTLNDSDILKLTPKFTLESENF